MKACPGRGRKVRLGKVRMPTGGIQWAFYHGNSLYDPRLRPCEDLVRCLAPGATLPPDDPDARLQGEGG